MFYKEFFWSDHLNNLTRKVNMEISLKECLKVVFMLINFLKG